MRAKPIYDWHESLGACLWWKFPVEEPPYVGTPLDTDWPGYHTHFTKIEVPETPAPAYGKYSDCVRCRHSYLSHEYSGVVADCYARPGPSEGLCSCDGYQERPAP